MIATARAETPRRARGAVLALAAAFGMLVSRAWGADEGSGRIERIDLKTGAAATKIIVMLSRPLPFHVRVLDGEEARKSAKRLVLDFEHATLAPEAAAPVKVDDGLVQQIRTGQPEPGKARIVIDLAKDVAHTVEPYETPPHVTVAIGGASAEADDVPPPSSASGGTAASVLLAPREPFRER
ncbi:MAG: AMIN domain-containing protein [Deltaproteobacteria bacterium]|nr:AMIN domain-containing protein [Deltaproteobacteria bacterium]